jgi:hypothetical protein
MTGAAADPDEGCRLFARYAYAPHKLGYCGPPGPAGPELLRASGAESPGAANADGHGRGGIDTARLRALARGFSGAWPYLEILARLAGVDDPLDATVVRAYWLGGGPAVTVDPRAFGRALLDRIGPQAGHYWQHLTPDLLAEAAPHHCFHVFGVYPWSRLLGPTGYEAPLHVLDSCRIRWARVREIDHAAGTVLVSNRRLTWQDGRLGLSQPRTEQVAYTAESRAFLPDLSPGDAVALHWDRVTDRLTDGLLAGLRKSTLDQLELTNLRLAGRPGTP